MIKYTDKGTARQHLTNRLMESALNNVGIKADADEVFRDIAENRLPVWIDELQTYDTPPKGWVCPKCGRVYAPFTPMCLYCGGEESVSISTTTGTPPEWGDRSWAFRGGAKMDEVEE